MQVVDDRAVPLSLDHIFIPAEPALIVREVDFRRREYDFHFLEGRFHDAQRGGLSEVETVTKINDRPQDERFFDSGAKPFRVGLNKLGPMQRPGGAIFPKIGTFSQPIVRIAADPDVRFAAEDFLSHGLIAAMKPEHKC